MQPKVVLVELFPFGRAKFARELVPLLEEARAHGRVHRLQPARHPRQRRRRRDDRARQLADAHLDAVLVHSDPRFARLEETFKPSSRSASPSTTRASSTGRNGRSGHHRGDHIVVSAGGGRVGPPLLEEAIARLQRPPDARDRRAADARRGLRAAAGARPAQRRAAAHASRTSPPSSATPPAASASAATTRPSTWSAPASPRSSSPTPTPEEDEQTRRARRLEQLGIVKVADHADPALLDFTPEPAHARPRRRRHDPDLL